MKKYVHLSSTFFIDLNFLLKTFLLFSVFIRVLRTYLVLAKLSLMSFSMTFIDLLHWIGFQLIRLN